MSLDKRLTRRSFIKGAAIVGGFSLISPVASSRALFKAPLPQLVGAPVIVTLARLWDSDGQECVAGYSYDDATLEVVNVWCKGTAKMGVQASLYDESERAVATKAGLDALVASDVVRKDSEQRKDLRGLGVKVEPDKNGGVHLPYTFQIGSL